MTPMADEELEQDPGPETVSLGKFDPLELPIILEALQEHGIFAMTKSPLEKAENEAYGVLTGSRHVLLVEKARKDEARRIIDGDVRARIAEMRATLDAGGAEIDFEAEGLVPVGWLEPEVARELLNALGEAGVRAEPEYPLDQPPPAYARADGRVRVHVEELFYDDALGLLEDEVREALRARGFTPAEPLVGEDE
jgi:hypothetical protein